MKKVISRIAWISILTLATVVLVLSFVPLLWPVVLILGGIVILISLRFLVKHSELTPHGPGGPAHWLQVLLTPVHHSDPGVIHRGERSARRAIRIATWAFTITLVLYGTIAVHSWACMIQPLSRELEPVRSAFRQSGIPLVEEDAQKGKPGP